MQTIEYFLSKLFVGIIAVTILVGLFFVIQKFTPNLFNNLILYKKGGFFTDNWLPDPINLQEMSAPKTADLSNNLYEGGMTPGTSYMTYTDKGMEVINVPPKTTTFNAQNSGFYDSSMYVRNLSIYNGESLNTGRTFYGEAKSSFFNNGTFPVYITDNQGKIFAKETAINTGDWSIPGWTRFSVQIRSLLPAHQACKILFIPDQNSQDKNTGEQVMTSIFCN